MRRLELLIEASRRETENEDFSDQIGISDAEFIRYANDAQDQLLSDIASFKQSLFVTEKIIRTVRAQEEYDLPQDLFLAHLYQVEYSRTGLQTDYKVLKAGNLKERISYPIGDPSFYIRRSKKILLAPSPNVGSGYLRISYMRTIPRLDTRRALISSVTTSLGEITSLVLSTNDVIDSEALLSENYVSVVDKDGNQTMRRIPIESIDTTTGIVTLGSGFEYEDGETIEAGNYLVSGPDSCNSSMLDDFCERYLISYMNYKVLKRDSSNDSREAAQELQAIREDILNNYKSPDSDVMHVAILDSQYLDNEIWD